MPPLQVSLLVQASPSLHGVVLLVCTQPVAGLQLSSVQTLLSLQLAAGPPTHAPAAQVSLVVQAFPSLQGPVLLVCTQPVAGTQLSSVQTLPSSQLGAGPPTQVPPLHASLVVQAFPSLHGLVLLVCTQPVCVLQVSGVQTLPSSQLDAGPPTHVPLAQVSLVVQAFPSLHGLVLLICVHPLAGLQASFVQTFPSSQLGAGPPTQVPPLQVSLVVQAFPSLQGLVLLVCTQPVAGLQLSSVQTLPSSQLGAGPPTHAPPAQVSLVVQAFPSLQGLGLLTCTHPLAGLQLSVVQTFPSSQLGAGPPTHAPAAQVSLVVQAFPSLQGAVLLMCTQPVAGLHESSVQTLLSLQLGAGPPTHVPPAQVSFVVQAFPSSQEAVLLVCVHPLAGSHASSVQTLLSLQLGAGPPTHVPPEHVSLVVQAFPSLQEAVLLVCTQPVAGLQLSSVQTLLSLQLGAGPPTQAPPLQVSLVVQAFPSLQGAVLLVWKHPLVGSQASSVQTLPSSQLSGAPGLQVPPPHTSWPLHTVLSSHEAVLLVCTHPVAGLQLSSVQTLLSLQLTALPSQNPRELQVSLVVQALPSLQEVPVAGVWRQACKVVSHVSVVHGLPSLHCEASVHP